MSQGFAPFYDVNRTYEDNYLQGPFGAFAEVMKGDSAAGASAQSAQTTQSQSSDQAEEFLGFRVNLPFGIPAGPLLNERFTTAAFRMEVVGEPEKWTDVQHEFQKEVFDAEGPTFKLGGIERFAFYEAAKKSFAVLQTGEGRLYGCFLLTKGVIPPKA